MYKVFINDRPLFLTNVLEKETNFKYFLLQSVDLNKIIAAYAANKLNGARLYASDEKLLMKQFKEKITVNEFAENISNHMKSKYPEMIEYNFSDDELQIIDINRQEKFGNWNWNFGSNPVAEIVRERRYPAGKTQLFINTKKGVIDDITFY